MSKTEFIRTRIEPEVKHQAEEILQSLGLTTSEATRLLMFQIIQHKGLPFAMTIPNADTKAAIEELEAGGGTRVSNIEEMFDVAG